MNLISEPWIPIRRADGRVETIAPWQLTDGIGENPILAVSSPRPDFDGALTQFLIGLLQTTYTPSEDQWWDRRDAAPAPEVLRERFEVVAHAFDLEGDRAFLQDFNPEQLDKKFGIVALLVGSPPENSDTDLFVKEDAVKQLCRRCVAAAIFALQTGAPEGGRGYRTGLRGGGPLTTLVLGDNLWDTCWLNVLEKSRYLAGASSEDPAAPERFPWLAPTRTSEAKPPAGVTTPLDVHPDQQYWTIPRRIRLVAEACEPVACDICGVEHQLVYRTFLTKNYGVNYDGFEHPLSPHYTRDSSLLPVHPRPGGIGYRHWLGLVESSADGSQRPARVVDQFRTFTRKDGDLWAFGFDMKSNKARCWYDARMPILSAPVGMEDVFRDLASRMVKAAEKAADDLRNSLKAALAGKAKVRGDLGFVQRDFWEITEVSFYVHLRQLRARLPDDPCAFPVLESWLQALRAAALDLFDRHSQTGDFDAVEPRRIALARKGLGKALAGAPLKGKILGLPNPTRAKSKTGSRRRP
ncbi:MAG: type I-E CRISPR-associated protein Cse1/CasA [Pseudomonadota bacterium]|nr:type I-E CRISPR-associated protein Cse1/CasA [Pseudomonadota bacterium]